MNTFRLAVLNPGGNDPEQHFNDGAGAPGTGAHPPVNYHAFAACTEGAFYRKESAIPAEQKAVLMLIRRDLKACVRAIVGLRKSGKTVIVALKEAGSFQVASLLDGRSNLQLFQELCARANGALAATPELVPFFRAAGAHNTEFIPTPYPVEDTRWDFSVPIEERKGIFLGTREFDVPSRNHLAALLTIRTLAEAMGEPVTVFNVGGWSGRRMLRQLRYPEGLLNVVEGRMPYTRYLQLMARHKLVFQLDASAVPGQVAGDALLCRIPCIGGNGTTERFAFPQLCGYGRTPEQLFDMAARLLEHPHDCEAIVLDAVEHAKVSLGFAPIARQLSGFFGQLSR
ncbi:hypothetical protein ACXR0O_09515 [Verrucomicrobiota bacterium sgz303538]